MTDFKDQQRQTLEFFDSIAGYWKDQAAGHTERVNIIAQRNDCVLDIIDTADQVETLLDIGCGTGDLVLYAANHVKSAIGVDFASEMIELCRIAADEARADNAKFYCSSIFDFEPSEGPFDCVSAMGFIEYISEDQLEKFLVKTTQWIADGGYLAVSSRNRLFNAFSLNTYTTMEKKLGCLAELMEEAVVLGGVEKDDVVFESLRSINHQLPQPKVHPDTGINVERRLQFTPSGLIRIFEKYSLTPIRLYGIHYHGLPPAVAVSDMDAHKAISERVYTNSRRDPRLIPFCSSFVLVGRKV
jgi:2-polyprenyl-3-methyl-5-hydroxy-6-metoxy-1,4-benzoquinol methylase